MAPEDAGGLRPRLGRDSRRPSQRGPGGRGEARVSTWQPQPGLSGLGTWALAAGAGGQGLIGLAQPTPGIGTSARVARLSARSRRRGTEAAPDHDSESGWSFWLLARTA